MLVNPYHPPAMQAEVIRESENCGCPCCGYEFTFGHIAWGWPVRMNCRNCKARLIGNGFIKWQAVLLVPLLAMLVAVGLAALLFVAGSVVALVIVGLFAAFATVLFIVAYVLATLRYGRYRVAAYIPNHCS